MINARRIVIPLLIVATIGFFYKTTIEDTYMNSVSFFYEKDIVKTLKLKLLTPQGNDDVLPTNVETKTSVLTTKGGKGQDKDKGTLQRTSIEDIPKLNISSKYLSPSEALKTGNGIIFVETTDKLAPSSLVLCAIESAAHHYPDRPVVFFMKGLTETNAEEVKNKHFSIFSSIKKVHFFPLNMETILADTPLLSWFKKVDPAKEIYWAHVSSDASRLALLWKYGGMYMDTDFISLRPVPHHNFLAAESKQYSNNAVLGFSSRHEFTWKCMEDFVRNYRGDVWGYQGPLLFTRIRNQFCDMGPFTGKEDFMCGNITILNPAHFYPIGPEALQRYYEVWDKEPTFEACYALHLWNYANRNAHRTMVPGSNTLIEHLYQKNCPSVYADLAGKKNPA